MMREPQALPKGRVYLFWAGAVLYAFTWALHLYIGTASLQGLSDDSAQVFLLHLSKSYVMNEKGHWVHWFSGGFPRDAQFALNTLALQAVLLLKVQDPQIFKYTYVFWQYALPGLLYLGLFFALYRKGFGAWAIFPLVSWAILSVTIDWNPVNSTRSAVPIFWMHFMLMLLAGPRVRLLPVLGVIATGLAMWGGLYESVVLYGGLCLIVGALLWWREGNRTPFIYALATIPGACRAALSLMATRGMAPNSFHGIILPFVLTHPYFLFIVVALAVVIGLSLLPRTVLPTAVVFTSILLSVFAAYVLTGDPPIPWVETEMKYDYAILSLVLMVWCAFFRVLQIPIKNFAFASTGLVLSIGAVLWIVQIQQTFEWQSCRADYEQNRQHATLFVDQKLAWLLKERDGTASFEPNAYYRCLWGQYTPWTDMLLAPDGRISHWSLTAFWQDFGFVQKDGQPYLRTNALALVSPAFQSGEANLPLKTMLYDLTPLYQKVGDGDLFPRTRCLPVEQSDLYWRAHLAALTDEQKQRMFVCPR